MHLKHIFVIGVRPNLFSFQVLKLTLSYTLTILYYRHPMCTHHCVHTQSTKTLKKNTTVIILNFNGEKVLEDIIPVRNTSQKNNIL